MDIYLILRIVNLIFGLTAIYYCLYSITRIEGKLEKAIIFLALAALVLTLVNLLGVMEVFYKVDLSTIKAVANSVTIFFTFFAAITIKKLIEQLDSKKRKFGRA